MRYYFHFILLLAMTFWISTKSLAADVLTERRIGVTMRMIGHQVLLSSGDSTSRVLPIQKVGDRYQIPFESDFAFDPSDLVTAIDSAMNTTGFANHYLVEVETCDSNKVVYSYEVGNTKNSDVIPCGPRHQPTGCYSLFVTLFDSSTTTTAATIDRQDANGGAEGNDKVSSSAIPFWAAPLILFLVLALFLWKNRSRSKPSADAITIGAYRFDPKSMSLHFEDRTIELTGKESELLYLLYSEANTTVERELILKKVWGDDGDYIGRTLDVFISKLRKKLEADSTVKILNIRGVGYKLVYSLA